jgi:hypothetical protein
MSAEPLIVADQVAAATAQRRLVRQGWRRTTLAELPEQPWDLSDQRLCCGVDAARPELTQPAILAAVRGVQLVVLAEPDRADTDAAFLDDLARVTPPAPIEPAVIADIDGLLALLAKGTTVTAAAGTLHVSRRTANRWLHQALARYDVDSTAAAVQAWVRAGT